jgi:hypothetical protein
MYQSITTCHKVYVGGILELGGERLASCMTNDHIIRYQYLVEIYSVSAEKIISDAFSYSEYV